MKHKVLAIVVSLVLIMSMVLPGTLAVSVDEDGASSTLTVDSTENKESTPTEAVTPTAGSTPAPTGTTDTPKEEAPEVKTVTEEKKCNCTPVDGVHANTCPLYEAPKTEEKTGDTQPPAETEKKCTCGAADGTHTAECALYVKPQETTPTTPPVTETQPQDPAVTSLFDQLMACKTLDELFTLADKTPEEQLLALTDEQNAQIEAKIAALEPEPLPPVVIGETKDEPVTSEIIYPTVNFDKVAPFGAPVGG